MSSPYQSQALFLTCPLDDSAN